MRWYNGVEEPQKEVCCGFDMRMIILSRAVDNITRSSSPPGSQQHTVDLSHSSIGGTVCTVRTSYMIVTKENEMQFVFRMVAVKMNLISQSPAS